MTRDEWLGLLGLRADEIPELLVLEGTWWRARALERRLGLLTDVRETGMPDLWWGRHDGRPVAYCPAYGASRAVEPVHVLGLCGTRVAVQIGSCGGLQPQVRTGDVVVSSAASIGEGASQYYGGARVAKPDAELVVAAAAAFGDLPVHVGPTVTTSALLAQPDELIASWAAAGFLGVDLETSAVFSAARALQVRAVSLLYAWDELPGRSWTDPFSPAETAAQQRAAAAVYRVALGLA